MRAEDREFVTFALSKAEFAAFNEKIKANCLNRSAILRGFVEQFMARETGTSLASQNNTSTGPA